MVFFPKSYLYFGLLTKLLVDFRGFLIFVLALIFIVMFDMVSHKNNVQTINSLRKPYISSISNSFCHIYERICPDMMK